MFSFRTHSKVCKWGGVVRGREGKDAVDPIASGRNPQKADRHRLMLKM